MLNATRRLAIRTLVAATAAALAIPGCGDDEPVAPAAPDVETPPQDVETADTRSPDPDSPCPQGATRNERDHCEPVQPADREDLTRCVAPPDATVSAADDAGLAAALAAATPGDVIALAPGTYAGGLTVPASVSLVGPCAAEVSIEGPDEGIAISISDASQVRLEGLTIRGTTIGIQAIRTSDLHLRRIVIEQTARGIDLQQTSALVEASDIRETVTNSVSEWLLGGIGVRAVDQSALVMSGVRVTGSAFVGVVSATTRTTVVGSVLSDNALANLSLEHGTSGLVEASTLADCQGAQGFEGFGLVLTKTAEVEIRGNVIRDNAGQGIVADDTGPLLIEENEITGGGDGIWIQVNSVAPVVRHNALASNAGAGIAVTDGTAHLGPGNSITATVKPPTGGFGHGIMMNDATDVVVEGNEIAGTASHGIVALGVTGSISGNTIRNTGGPGLRVQFESTRLTATGNTFQDCTGFPLVAALSAQALVEKNTFDGVVVGSHGAQDGILVLEAAARIQGNLWPEPTGLLPVPFRSAMVIDSPLAPVTPDYLDLTDAQAVVVDDNTVEKAEYGVVLQGVSTDLVSVSDDNDLSGATETVVSDLELNVEIGPVDPYAAMDVPTVEP